MSSVNFPISNLFVAHGCIAMAQARDEQSEPGYHTDWVLVIDADPALYGLIEEWLAADGYRVIPAQGNGAVVRGPIAVAIVDIPFPRNGGLDRLKRIAGEHPGTPILALSSNFFSNIESSGAVARSLGIAGVLPKPLKRDTLIAAVRDVLENRK